MSKHLTRKSDAQANAEALARRSSTYADQHAASWQVRFNRPSHERRSLRDLVRDLRRAYADEVPSRMHVHDVDGGGTPALSPEFKAYLMGPDDATDKRDDGTTEILWWPFRTALQKMLAETDAGMVQRARLTEAVVVTGLGPIDAAIALGVPDWAARDVAEKSLEIFWKRLSDVKLYLREQPAA